MSSKVVKKFKIGRRLGAGVLDKCATPQFTSSQSRKSKAGRPKKISDYGYSLLDKQRVRYAYGISERQLQKYVKNAHTSNTGDAKPANMLFQNLEQRIDNIVYRLGLAQSRRMARQMVSHGHFLVNDRRTMVPSQMLRIGDKISVRDNSRESTLFHEADKKMAGYKSPAWLKKDASKLTAEIIGAPADPDPFFNFSAVIEYYSR